MLIIAISIVSTLLLGYRWGKHDGRKEGYEQGVTDVPVLLREQSLEQGYCLLCNNPSSEDQQLIESVSSDYIPSLLTLLWLIH